MDSKRIIRRSASSTHWSNRCGFKDSLANRLTEEEARRVDAAWRLFWAKRKFDPPPSVSSKFVGVFNLPSRPLASWQDLTFGKGSRPRRYVDEEWDFEGHTEE